MDNTLESPKQLCPAFYQKIKKEDVYLINHFHNRVIIIRPKISCDEITGDCLKDGCWTSGAIPG